MTHLWGDADLVFCPLSGCCRSVGLAVGGNWARYKVFPMVSLPGWAFVVWGHFRFSSSGDQFSGLISDV